MILRLRVACHCIMAQQICAITISLSVLFLHKFSSWLEKMPGATEEFSQASLRICVRVNLTSIQSGTLGGRLTWVAVFLALTAVFCLSDLLLASLFRTFIGGCRFGFWVRCYQGLSLGFICFVWAPCGVTREACGQQTSCYGSLTTVLRQDLSVLAHVISLVDRPKHAKSRLWRVSGCTE